MNEVTRAALEESIAHWKRLGTEEAYLGESTGAVDCPLCALFILRNDKCNGCPVMKKTGVHECRNTPYLRARRAFLHGPSAEWRDAQDAMIQFLESLREES